MDRWSIDLGTARDDLAYMISSWKYFYVGDCDGTVTIKLGSMSSSPFNPEEFDKLTDVNQYYYLYVTNTAQVGKKLVIYFEPARWRLW
jgi:hypothetical protein